MTKQEPVKDFFVALGTVIKGLLALGIVAFWILPLIALPLSIVVWLIQIPFIGVQ